VTARQKNILKALGILAALVVVVRAAWRFPWCLTCNALLSADTKILLLALAVNLVSLLVKGWGWHLLLKPVAFNRWTAAQEANLIGATVNCLSVSLAGEAARIHLIVKRDSVPLQAAIASVFWARGVEVVGLGLFLLAAPGLLDLPPVVRGAQVGAALLLLIFLGLILFRREGCLPAWLPLFVSSTLKSFAEIGSRWRLVLPTGFALVNWAAQWATFHLVLLSVHTRPSLEASFMALLATNLAGLLRLTPANVGIFQVAMVGALLPFGIPSEQAMAASLVLQGIQVSPVVVLGLALGGWRTLNHAKAAAA
jgi:uncharacterized membrane protein YbhN (UPF0104 family)